MNDIGYIKSIYKGSELAKSISDNLDGLSLQATYTVGAILYHKKENNPKQVAFFSEHLKEIDKKVRRLTKIKDK